MTTTFLSGAKLPSDSSSNPIRQRFRHTRRSSFLRVLFINVLILLIPIIFYYVVVVQEQKARSIERGFRALAEIQAQFENRLEAVVGMVNTLRGPALDPKPIRGGRAIAPTNSQLTASHGPVTEPEPTTKQDPSISVPIPGANRTTDLEVLNSAVKELESGSLESGLNLQASICATRLLPGHFVTNCEVDILISMPKIITAWRCIIDHPINVEACLKTGNELYRKEIEIALESLGATVLALHSGESIEADLKLLFNEAKLKSCDAKCWTEYFSFPMNEELWKTGWREFFNSNLTNSEEEAFVLAYGIRPYYGFAGVTPFARKLKGYVCELERHKIPGYSKLCKGSSNEKAELKKAELKKAELEKAELEKAELEKAELERVEWEERKRATAPGTAKDYQRQASAFLPNLQIEFVPRFVGIENAELQNTERHSQKCFVNGARSGDLLLETASESYDASSYAILRACASEKLESRESGKFEIRLPLGDLIANSSGLKEFDQVFIATAAGNVIYAYGGEGARRNTAQGMFGEITNPPRYADVRDLLTHANLLEVFGSAEAVQTALTTKDATKNISHVMKDPRVGRQMIVEQDLGGRSYKVFLKPVPLPSPLKLRIRSDAGTFEPEPEEGGSDGIRTSRRALYLIAISKNDPLTGTAQMVKPTLVLGIVVLIAIILFAWPLARLFFLEPHDGLSRAQVAHLLVSTLLLIGLLVLLSNTMESITTSRLLLDNHAKSVSGDIERWLEDRVELIVRNLVAMSQYPDLSGQDRENKMIESRKELEQVLNPELNLSARNEGKAASAENQNTPGDICHPIDEPVKNGLPLPHCHGWTLLRTDAAGKQIGQMLHLYGKSVVRKGFSLANREYFKSLRDGHYWHLPNTNTKFVTERAYNLGDGTKLTQFAIPANPRILSRSESAKQSESSASDVDAPTEFHGVAMLTSRMLELTSAVLPLHYQFAIIDRATGTVVFHSDDHRSLAENFFIETGENPELLAATRDSTVPTMFSARYHGRLHKFRYTNLSFMPWALVVFYPTALGDGLSLETFMVVFTAFFAFVFYLVTIPITMFRLCFGRMYWLWPQWRLRNAYLIAIPLFVLALVHWLALSSASSLFQHVMVLATSPLSLLGICYALLQPDDWKKLFGIFNKRKVTAFSAVASLAAPGYVLAANLSVIIAVSAIAVCLGSIGYLFRTEIIRLWNQSSVDGPSISSSKNVWRQPVEVAWEPVQTPGAQRVAYIVFFLALLLNLAVVPVIDFQTRASQDRFNAALSVGHADMAEQMARRAQRMQDDFRRMVSENDRSKFSSLPDYFESLAVFGAERVERVDRLEPPGCDIAADPENPRFTVALSRRKSPPENPCSPVKAGKPNDWPELVWREWAPVFDEQSGRVRMTANDQVAETETSPQLVARRWFSMRERTQTQPASSVQPSNEAHQEVEVTDVHFLTEVASPEWRGLVDTIDWSNRDYLSGAVIPRLLCLLAAFFVIRFLMDRFFWVGLPWTGLLGPRGYYEDKVGTDLRYVRPKHEMMVRISDLDFSDLVEQKLGEDRDQVVNLARDDLATWQRPGAGTWILKNLDTAVVDDSRRVKVLEYLEKLIAKSDSMIWLTVDVPPLYRLVHPDAYPSEPAEKAGSPAGVSTISSAEVLRWCKVLGRFRKVYPGREFAPAEGGRRADQSDTAYSNSMASKNGAQSKEFLLDYAHREARTFWPELSYLREELVKLIESPDRIIRDERDIREYLSMHAEVTFRRRWEYCTREERLALYQLARGWSINTKNSRVLEHLVRRGFVVLEPMPRIVNDTLVEFILHSEEPGRFEMWQTEASEGIWQTLRFPIFIIFMLLIAWLAYSAGDVFETLAAILASTLGFFATIVRAIGFARGADTQLR